MSADATSLTIGGGGGGGGVGGDADSLKGLGGPAICPLCQRTFGGRNRKQHLENHILTHTGEKPFACFYCHYRSSRKDTLHTHLRKWHPEQWNL